MIKNDPVIHFWRLSTLSSGYGFNVKLTKPEMGVLDALVFDNCRRFHFLVSKMFDVWIASW